MSRTTLNRILFCVIAILVLLAWFLRRDFAKPNYVFTPEMVFSVPYDSYFGRPRASSGDTNPNFRDGKTMQLPVEGTVARGTMFFDYEATEADALRAAEELTNPWRELGIDSDLLLAAKDRGRTIYTRFCFPCHGAAGNADGPVAKQGFLGVTPFNSETSLQMKDGQMFHLVTFGQTFIKDKRMPAYASQVSADDRWKAILHVRSLQEAAVRKAEADQLAQASILAGEQLFERLNCNKCHTVSADVKPVGPFLGKVAGVYSREQLQEAILHPSKTIAEGFLSQMFLMLDGSTHSGFVTNETEEQITLRNTDGNEIILEVEEIDERKTLEKSPMPDGIIKDLTDDELQSLLDYLKSIATDAPVKEDASEAQDQEEEEGTDQADDQNTDKDEINPLRVQK